MNSVSKKERDQFIKELIKTNYDDFNYEVLFSEFEEELNELTKGTDDLVFFEDYKLNGNSVILNTVTDSGILVESSFKNSLKKI